MRGNLTRRLAGPASVVRPLAVGGVPLTTSSCCTGYHIGAPSAYVPAYRVPAGQPRETVSEVSPSSSVSYSEAKLVGRKDPVNSPPRAHSSVAAQPVAVPRQHWSGEQGNG